MSVVPYPLMLQAISFAARKHVGQVRKDGRTPYIAHPTRVLAVLATVFEVRDPEILAAAALHDTIEDTTTDWDELKEAFGERVANIVSQLSKDKRLEESEREHCYYETLKKADVEVRLCKLADLYDNLVDAATLQAKQRSRTLEKAQYALDLFAPDFPEDYRFALERFEERIRGALGSPGPT
jgi:guanosine-3',5'-bis(diphosphate) 3'-pyrophosphohydrolase